MNKGRLIEMGRVTTVDEDDERHKYEYALVIVFDSPEKCREAIANDACEFEFLPNAVSAK